MTSAMPSVLALTTQDHATVQTLLAQAHLPCEDLSPEALRLFLGVYDQDAPREPTQDRLIGIVGLEAHGGDGLLRSLFVLPEHRGRGLAHALVLAQEAQARRLGLSRLVLLTETAADFFRTLGYRDTDRDTLSAGLLASTQFQQLCPASARCLSKTL
ncbi:arsenic resistance N-acetyltransferase ArsN2 [Hylemonella sp. W303a]|uniref:arsenic resistance N-acetyltransferase ArsN2 n=1 Tax=Hylemonella sp. W303a TaxID=3389873 RepID=UPI00396B3945